MLKVDLNSDLGESFGGYQLGCDGEIVKYISSANLACGWHAGDPVVMEKSVDLCAEAGVSVGAHPGYYDVMGFGRRYMKLSPEEARAYIKYQLGALAAFAKSRGVKIQHLKAHGALGNAALKDEALAEAICRAVAEVDPESIVMSLANCCVVKTAARMGLRWANEVFADRAYNEDYTLVSRGKPGAVIHDASIDMSNPAPSSYQAAAEMFGYRLYGAVILVAGTTTILGAAAIFLSFTKTYFRWIQEHERLTAMIFIGVCTVVDVFLGQPVNLVVAAGSINTLVLPFTMLVMLIASHNKRIMGEDYQHPVWMTVGAAAVFVLSAYLSTKNLPNLLALSQ